MNQISQSLAYGFTLLATSAAILVRWLLDPWLGEWLPLTLLYIPVALSVWLGGWRPAALAAIVGMLISSYLFIEPRDEFLLLHDEVVARALTFFTISGVIIAVGENMRREQRRAIQAAEATKESGARAASMARRLELITDAIPALVAYVDAEQRYQFNNKAYEVWFGVSRENIKGKPLREVLGEEAYAQVRPHIEAALSGQPVSFDGAIPYRYGGLRPIHADYVSDIQPDGSVAGFYVLVTDLTNMKAAEAKMLQAEKFAAVGNLAAGLSHDMSNLVMPLQTGLEMLRHCELSDPRAREALNLALHSSEALGDMAKGVRHLVRTNELQGNSGTIDLGKWWLRAERLLRASLPRDITLEGKFEGLPLIHAHEGGLMRAVLNLVVNASDAISEAKVKDGRIRICGSRGDDDSIVRLAVIDNGPGIPVELRERVFEPFFSTKKTGYSTGMGMSIVKDFVHQAGGSISLHSTPGSGTRVVLNLPAVKAPASVQASATSRR